MMQTKDEILILEYGRDENGLLYMKFELNERQEKYLTYILEKENNLRLAADESMIIRSVLNQGYYFQRDVDLLNGLKNTMESIQYSNKLGFYVPQGVMKVIGKLNIK